MGNRTTTTRADAAVVRQLDRRAVLGGAAGVAATGLATRLGAPATAAAQNGKATFVLVHGAWAGSWIWSKVIPFLRAEGHDVYAVTLTGLGDRTHLADPAINLDTHITDVVNLIEFEDLHDVQLVGHSYSGMVVTGVAEQVPERLAQVVYLDADVPTDGQNGWAAELYTEEAILSDVLSGGAAGMPGFLTVEPYTEWIQGMTAPADAEWLLSKLRPQSLATYIQPIKLGNSEAAALPRAFIYCTENPLEMSTGIAERVRSEPNWRVVEVADNHLVNVNDPQATAEALLSLV
jgi:pimeloyl-ACP methyl ester carboxylesterase